MFWPHLQDGFLQHQQLLPRPANSSQAQTSLFCLIIFHHFKANISTKRLAYHLSKFLDTLIFYFKGAVIFTQICINQESVVSNISEP